MPAVVKLMIARLPSTKAAVSQINGGQHHHHREGGQDEGHADEGRAPDPALNPAEVDCQLGRQRTGRELGQGQVLLVVTHGDPAAFFDQIALHVAGQSDGAAEAEGAEPEEIAEQLVQGTAGLRAALACQGVDAAAHVAHLRTPLIADSRMCPGTGWILSDTAH